MHRTAKIDIDGVKDYVKENWKQIRCMAESSAGDYFTAFLLLVMDDPGWTVTTWNAANVAHNTINNWIECSREDVEYQTFFPPRYERCLCVEKGGQLTREKDLCLGATEIAKIGDEGDYKRIIEQWIEGDTSFCKAERSDGTISTQKTYRPAEAKCFSVDWFIVPQNGGNCCGQTPNIPDPPPPPPPTPIIQTDECEWTVQQIDVAIQDGIWEWKKYKVSPNFSPCGAPFCYWESENGAVICDDCTCPPPFGGGGGGNECGCGLSAVTYKQHVPCSWDEDDKEYKQILEWKIDEEDNGILGLARRMDAIATMIDSTLLIQRYCGEQKPKLKGDWVTINWISDLPSSDSPLRLRKRTRYRTQSGRSEPDLAKYHAQFFWDAGPVCVKHVGAWWGSPQVWAKTADEGKRVIRHIAGEAGIDPDKDGRWEVSGSRNPRFGRRGRMRVRQVEGFPWITARNDSNMLPMQQEYRSSQ